MENILTKLKKEKIKSIISISLMIIIAFAIAISATIYMLQFNKEEAKNAKVRNYDKYMVVTIEVDGEEYTNIEEIPKVKKNNPTDNLKVTYNKTNPKNISIDYGPSSMTVGIVSVIVVMTIVITIGIISKIYNKNIRIVENGFVAEADVIKNTKESLMLKWVNPEDNKCFYYIFNKEKYEKNWIEKIEKIYIIINKQNYKEFYVVGKEMV